MLLALLIIGGLVVLVFGADLLVRGASHLAFLMSIPPLIVGLTVVAFGTSAPELAVSIKAAFAGQAGVGLGNVFGSNIVNTFLILGVSALITPLVVSKQLIKLDVPIMIGASAVCMLMALDGAFTRSDGLILVVALAAYMGLQFQLGRSGSRAIKELAIEGTGVDVVETVEDGMQAGSTIKQVAIALVQCVLGLVGLVAGANLLVNGAVTLAENLGVSSEVIGLTIVAIGTSLPEIVTSLLAALKGQRDLAVGNVVGSNLFNLLAVLGVASSVAPEQISVATSLAQFDIPVMVFSAVVCLPVFWTGSIISRKEGAFFFLCYIAYNAYQFYLLSSKPAME